jgi:hypothetical protein
MLCYFTLTAVEDFNSVSLFVLFYAFYVYVNLIAAVITDSVWVQLESVYNLHILLEH